MPTTTKPTLSLVSKTKPSANPSSAMPMLANNDEQLPADLSYLENEDFLNMGVFELLGVSDQLSEQEQLTQLSQMQGIIIADFLQYDIPNLISEESNTVLADEIDMRFAAGISPAAIEIFMMEELEKLGAEPQEVLAMRSVIFKHALVMEHIETLKAAADILQVRGKDIGELNSKLVNVSEVVETNKWKEFPESLKLVDEIVRKLVGVVE